MAKALMFRDLLEAVAGGDPALEVGAGSTFEKEVAALIESEKLKLSDFGIRDLAKTFCKVDESGRIIRGRGGFSRPLSRGSRHELLEAGSPVSSSAWPTVTSQLMFAEIRAPFEDPELVLSQRVPVKQSDVPGTEQIPSATALGDQATEVLEGREYDRVGTSEVTYTDPAKKKYGGIAELTKEMIRFDRTGLAVAQCRGIGKTNSLKKEKRLADHFVGASGAQNYIRNGTGYSTYLTSGAWINRVAGSLALSNYQSIDTLRQLFANMRDPDTAEPLPVRIRHLVVLPALEWTARQIVNATEVRSASNPAAGTVNETRVGPNPVPQLEVITSALIRDRVLAGPEPVAATADTGWWLGDLLEFLEWVENWGLEVEDHSGGDAAFYRDVELSVKASYRGEAHVREPRAMARAEGTAW